MTFFYLYDKLNRAGRLANQRDFMKKFFFILPLLLVGLLFPFTGLLASIFPNDTKMAMRIATGTGSACTDILDATSTPRTLLWGKITTNTASSDSIINVDGVNFLDSTYSLQGVVETFAPVVVPAGIAVTCTRTTGRSFIFRIAYVDYDLTQVSNDINININGTASSTIGTVGTTTMINNIENIGYIATTTQLANGQTFTEAVFNIPFNLFIFMAVLFFAIMLIVVLSIYFIKTKKDDY